jgi:antitoxin HicB
LIDPPFSEVAYAVRMRRQSGGWIVSCRDLPELVTDGDTPSEALNAAEGAAQAALEYRLREGLPVPRPTPQRRGERLAAVPVETALKLLLREAVQREGTQSAVARRLRMDEKALRRLLDPGHGSRIDALAEALRKLGLRVAVSVIDPA